MKIICKRGEILFVDQVKISLKAGDGGNGIHVHEEKNTSWWTSWR